jgi:inorganic phosphate transporter, PiT family
MALILILIAVAGLAYANGANDNFKGVATLFGSGTTDYRGALAWATVTTFLGTLAAAFLAARLLENFTGRGLVDDRLVASPQYVQAVALGACLTVLLATKIGMPISTTHGLVGALVGAGWAAGSAVNMEQLGTSFFAPLLVAPLLAIGLTGVSYPLLHGARRRWGITEQTCFCVGDELVEVSPRMEAAAALQRTERLSVAWGSTVECRTRYAGRVLGVEAPAALDWGHYASAGAVSFARGLNDAPKIAALLLVVPHVNAAAGLLLIGVSMAVGGLLSVRRVAETVSCKITPMNHGQGFVANAATAILVIGASRWGMPVSTTHVSCGALFGIGTITGQGRWAVIGTIFAAWVTTLPLGATLGAIAYWAIP